MCQCRQEQPMSGVADILFQVVKEEYRLYSLDIRNRQTTIQNIYFWIASTLFTLYAAVFHGMFTGNTYIHLGIAQIEPAVLPKYLVFAAFSLCAYVILTGVNAMRGRGQGQRLMLGQYSAATLLNSYITTSNLTHTTAMCDLLERIGANAYENARANQRVGKHLRKTSYALILAIICGIIAFIF